MAKEVTTIIRSDLSGEIVPDEKAATVTIDFVDRGRNRIELDVSEDEIRELVDKGREIKRRGRKPGTRNRPKEQGGGDG